jgi:acetyl esterase/lipase
MDPELEVIASQFAGMPASNSPKESREIARRVGAAQGGSAHRDALLVTDRVIAVPSGAPDISVRVYEPQARTRPTPAMVGFHGGGFIAGDLDSEDARFAGWSNGAGIVVVSVDYRLAPEQPFPAAVDDCYAALEWVAASADELGIDRTRLGVGGGSAGGCLAAALALLARDRQGPALAFQLLAYPCLDDRMTTASVQFVGTPLVDGAASRKAWAAYLGEARSEVSPYAAPARASDLRRLPPAYVMTAELDPLRDEGIEYASRLLGAGVPVELHQFAGAFHGFDLFPTALSRRAAEEQVAWLRWITAHHAT